MFTLIRLVFSLLLSFRMLLVLSGLALVLLLGDALFAQNLKSATPSHPTLAQKLSAAAQVRAEKHCDL